MFDYGTTFQGSSLNAQLVQGSDLMSSLVRVITIFLKDHVVIMVHQVRVPSSDADLLRFLW